MLEAIEMYLYYFRKKKPDVFIFGHTHEATHTTITSRKADKKRLINKAIDVWNIGCFTKGKDQNGMAGTFIVTDDSQQPETQIGLYQVTIEGNVQALRQKQ